MGLSINFHIGFNSENVDLDDVTGLSRLDQVAWAANLFQGNARCVTELIVGRVCERYPTLRFVSVESGVGFLPFLVQALDWQFLNNNLHREYPGMLLPSEYFRRQIYGTFWFEQDIAQIAELFPDNFMFETDYPHSTSLTPAESLPYVTGPRETIVGNLGNVPDDVVVKLLEGNAARVYGLS